MRELLNKRTLYAKHFDIGGGQHKAEIYAAPIHYKKNGKLEEVKDFKLVKANGEINSDADDFKIKVKGLKTQIKTGSLEILGLYVDDVLLEAPKKTEPTLVGNRVLYEDIFDGIDVFYDITPHSITENIILKKNPLKGKDTAGQKLRVKFDTKGLEEGDKPFAFDATGRAIEVDADKAIETSLLYASTYPITIDPYFSLGSSAHVSYNTSTAGYVKTNTPTSTTIGTTSVVIDRFTTHYLYNRVYLKFDLSSLSGATITSANWEGTVPTLGYGTGYLRQVTSEIAPTTATDSTVYANANGTQIATFTVSAGTKIISVTSYVNTHKGGDCDFGVTGTETTGTSYPLPLDVTTGTVTRLDITYTTGTTYTSTHTMDAIIWAKVDKTHTVDAVIKALDNLSTNTIDGIVAIAVQTLTKEHSLDAIVKTTSQKDYDIDAIVRAVYSTEHTFDGIIKEVNAATHSIDAAVKEINTKTHSIDAIVKEINQKTSTIDSIVKASYISEYSVDGIISESSVKTITIDGTILSVSNESFDADAMVTIRNTKTFDVDAVNALRVPITHSLSGDIAERTTKTHQVDGIIKEINTATVTIDGIIRETKTTEQSVDTIVREINLATHTLDAEVIYPTIQIYKSGSSMAGLIDFSETDYTNVSESDNLYKEQSGLTVYYTFEDKAETNTQTINPHFEGNCTNPSTIIYLQILNRTSGLWETLDSGNGSTDFVMTGNVDTNLTDYYDENNWVKFRVYGGAE